MAAMVPTGFILYGVLVPATILGAVLALAWWRSGRTGHADAERAEGRAWAGAVGVTAGWAIGFHASNGAWPDFPPTRATEMLFYLGLFGGLMGVTEGMRSAARGPVSVWSRLPLAVAAPWLLLRNLVPRWEASETVIQIGVAAAFVWVTWISFEALARKCVGFLAPVLLWCVVTAGSVAFLWTGSALYAQLAGTLAAFLGAALVVSLVRPALSLARGAAGAIGIVFACLCVGAVHFSNLPATSGVLLGLAPASVLLTGRGERPSGPVAVLVRVLVVAVPLVIALWLAHLAAPPPNPYLD